MHSQGPLSARTSLKQRLLKGGAWTFAGYGLSQAIRFGSNLVMTRLLVPDTFALMAIATIVMVGLAMFSDLGLKPVIVQSKRGDDSAFLNTAWVVQILRGVLLWFIAFAISLVPFVAHRFGMVAKDSVYADPRLPYVIAAVSFSAIIAGFNSTKLFEASRHLMLGRVTLIEIIAQTAGLMCIFGWISFDRSISALVAGNIFSSLVMMLLSHGWLSGTTNRWTWDKSAFQEIIHFGKWIFSASILSFLVGNGDRLVLGGMIDKTMLGVYVIAYFIVSSVEMVLTRIISGVMFPAFSEIVRERIDTLKANYYRMHTAVAAFAYFCSGVLMMSGQSLIELFYDRRYTQAGWMLEILATGIIAIPFQMMIQSFLALGMPKLQSHVLAVQLAVLCLAMPLGFHFFGLPGALWGRVFSQVLPMSITIIYSMRYGVFGLRQELVPLPILLAGAGTGKILAFIIRGHSGF
jgi:O-antigen/teichoic acid export membrane protein